MAILSLILAIVGAIVVLLGFIPSISFFNWIGGIIALVGLVLGFVGRAEKKTVALIAIIVSAVFVILAVLRLIGLF